MSDSDAQLSFKVILKLLGCWIDVACANADYRF